MNGRFTWVAAALGAVLVLSGCQTGGTGTGGETRIETPAAGDVYAPKGLDGASVAITPVGRARIGVIDGQPAPISAGAAGEYRSAKLLPGDHVLHVGTSSVPQGMNLSLPAEAGRYYAQIVTYVAGGEKYWTPVIVSGAPDGPIVADKDGLLIGKTPAEASKLLAAAAAKPAAADDKQAAAARAQALFDKATESLKANRVQEALKALDEALAIVPAFDSALALRGSVLARLKRPAEGLESLDEAIRVGGNARGRDDEWMHWPWLEKGLVLMAQRKPRQALAAFDESIRVKATDRALAARADLRFALGDALGKKNDWNGAEPYFKGAQADAEAALAMRPKSVKLWSLKAATHIMLNEHAQACTAIRQACELGDCSLLEQFPQCKPGS